MEKIFVQIASYRDPECQWTVKDLFDKAAHPERVFVGICWQYSESRDKACFTEAAAWPNQVRTVIFDPKESKGSGWAKMQAQSLWRGEEYVLQIHAHTRFEPGWDDTLIVMLAGCPSEKPVLATCLPGYAPPATLPHRDEARSSFVIVQSVQPQDPHLVHFAGSLYSKDAPLAGVTHSPFWTGTFLFARSELMLKVPFDPHLFYFGEPIAYSARLWTHGYDIFEPDRLVAYHWWGRGDIIERPYRDAGDERHPATFQRMRHLLRLEASPDSVSLRELDQYGLGDARPLADFWQFAGIDLKTGEVKEWAQKGRWDEAWQRLLNQPTPPPVEARRIFVQIASYRDPECQWTVKDLFEKAARPERVFVGICWQYDPEADKNCFQLSARPDQVRVAPFHWNESQGISWARQQTQQLWEGEEYTLVIDSHMRFAFGWDTRLIEELGECASPKPILSTHPASYTPPHTLERDARPIVLSAQAYANGIMRFRGETLGTAPEKPLRGAFIAAGYQFARSDVIREIPYDPYLYFSQEEMAMSARLFTHGWDVYHPRDVLLYHYYTPPPGQRNRPMHWDDHPEWNRLQDRERLRVEHLFGRQQSNDAEAIRDLDRYGLGMARSLAEYQTFCGIDFKTQAVSARAMGASFIENLKKYKAQPAAAPAATTAKASQPRKTKADITAPPADIATAAAETGIVTTFPYPEKSANLPYDTMLLANNQLRSLQVEHDVPEGVLIIHDYIERPICEALMRYADSQSFTTLGVVDHDQSTDEEVKSVPNEGRITTHVEIDGMACEILTIFNDIYCHRLAPFYNVNFEWYERPQILRYPPGGRYNQHSDADHWIAEEDRWIRSTDRDYSVLLYLNDDYVGGELHLVEQDFKIRPTPGMLLAFPSDYRYLHAALPTTSGIRYVIVSWAAIVGTPRVRTQIPYGSVYVRQNRF